MTLSSSTTTASSDSFKKKKKGNGVHNIPVATIIGDHHHDNGYMTKREALTPLNRNAECILYIKVRAVLYGLLFFQSVLTKIEDPRRTLSQLSSKTTISTLSFHFIPIHYMLLS